MTANPASVFVLGPRLLRGVAVVLGMMLLTTACVGSDTIAIDEEPAGLDSSGDEFDDDGFDDDGFDDDEFDDEGFDDEDEFDDDEFDDDEDGATDDPGDEPTSASSGPDVFPGGGVDPSRTRDDIDCSEDGLGEDGTVDFTLAHYIVDGDLGAVCFGDPDPRLVSAWETLAQITPSGQLLDLALFGGFASTEGGDETTLAFVNTLDDAGSIFQMSVNLDAGDEDPNELMLTMAHEFSHVFTALSTELDRFAEPDECETFYNGEGCYLAGSLMAEWIQLFWGDGLIDEIDPFEEATGAAGEDRCAVNPGFFGAYAASSPEEDFAESFSAFVFRLTVDSDEQQDRMDWFARQPGLVEFRDLATAAGLGPLQNNFDYCGE